MSNSEYKSADASSEGVQRDLLPLIEGKINENESLRYVLCRGDRVSTIMKSFLKYTQS